MKLHWLEVNDNCFVVNKQYNCLFFAEATSKASVAGRGGVALPSRRSAVDRAEWGTSDTRDIKSF